VTYAAVGFGIRLLGPIFVMTFYALVALHVYAQAEVILVVLKKRLGTNFGLLWISIGVIILYNVVYNHFFAMMIKPGSPQDLKVRAYGDFAGNRKAAERDQEARGQERSGQSRGEGRKDKVR